MVSLSKDLGVISVCTMIKQLCKAYPGFRDRMVQSADYWITLDGEFLWHILIGNLTDCLVENIRSRNYEYTDQLFQCVDMLMGEGSEEVVDLVTTGFLEGMLNQREVDEQLWRPLLGPKAELFCRKIDDFYG